jgi:Histidine kinase-, DNA gyrase B-, and HSP90-like ATPase
MVRNLIRLHLGTHRVRLGTRGSSVKRDPEESTAFEPFGQMPSPVTGNSEGTGLGLAVSRELARGMGGDVAVASEVGAGSTFTLTVPHCAVNAGLKRPHIPKRPFRSPRYCRAGDASDAMLA